MKEKTNHTDRNGLMHGKFEYFHFNSPQLMVVGRYKNGVPINIWTWFNKDGSIEEEILHIH